MQGRDIVTNIKGLLLTFIVGLFFLLGIAITKKTKKKKELNLFATGMAFVVMMSMILFDIIPEIKENIFAFPEKTKWIFVFGLTILGILILKILDIFIPHHHHEHKEKEKNIKEHNEHLFHIGFVTSISLMLHNILEGMSIYATSLTNFKTGILMTLAVSLHNLPLGIEISVGMESADTKKKTKQITMFLLTISSFLGGFFLFLIKEELPEIILASVICVTFGMLLYIALFELLKEIWMNKKEKYVYYGMIIGILISIIMVVL